MFGTPCSSLSRAIRPPVRTATFPLGLPGVSQEWQAKIGVGNTCALATAKLCTALHALGRPWMIENPRTSFLWLLPCIQRLRDLPRTVLITCDMCAFGTRYRKRTGLLVGNCDPQDLLRLQCLCGGGGKKPCSFTGKPNYILEGGVNTRKAAM